MVYLITGGSGSGKSEYAESLVLASPCPRRFYVATMAVYGEEGKAKVKRHQALRRGKGFITVECLTDVHMALSGTRGWGAGDATPCREDAALLLECVSNLAANEMFCGSRIFPARELADKLARDIKCLASQVRDMVIVTNEVASDGNPYDRETMEYIRLMGLLNQSLAGFCDQVVEVVYGIPVMWKG